MALDLPAHRIGGKFHWTQAKPGAGSRESGVSHHRWRMTPAAGHCDAAPWQKTIR
jgi:hypothetical protein